MTSAQLIIDIKNAERCELTAYKDTNGFWTIGWGHKLRDQHRNWEGTTIDQGYADTTLDTDIANATKQAVTLNEWGALDTGCRQNAFIELIFNMGTGTWMQFNETREAIQKQEWQTVHDHLLASKWASEVHATRANRIAGYFLTGQYP